MRAVAAAQAITRPVARVDRAAAAMGQPVLGIQAKSLQWPVLPTQVAAVVVERLAAVRQRALPVGRESSLCATQSPKFPAFSPCSERNK